YACRHFGLPFSGESVFTSEEGLKNWKKATFKDGGILCHARSEAHTTAILAWAECEKSTSRTSSLSASLDAQHSKLLKENREYICHGATCYYRLQSPEGALTRVLSSPPNKGNFLAIMELLAKHNPIVTSQRNATYLGHDTQNEIIDCLGEMVGTSITSEVAQCEAFSILVDETKDMSKREQMSFVIRYYYNGSVCESFLPFEAAQRLDAAALSHKIIQILQKHGLDYKKHLVGQAYDGASVMSGKNTGVQACIKSEALLLSMWLATPALVDSLKCIPEANCFFSILQKLYVFVSGSYVHRRWLEVQREMFQGAPKELERLTETRWACRYNACKTVRDRLPAIERLLKEISEEQNGDSATLSFLLATFTSFLGEIKYLSDILQSPQLDLGTAVTLVDALVDTLESYREGSLFNVMWDNALKHCFFTPIVQRQATTEKESFRTGSFIPVIDVLLSEVKRRFSKENYHNERDRGLESMTWRSGKQAGWRLSRTWSEEHWFKLCKVALALPVSTASCERSFSTPKRIKTALRSTMPDERLSNLGVLSVESRRAKAVNLDDFVDVFGKKNSNRRMKLF
uniref:DUF4371 domain-containing protein n=1 Tax=Oryzias melastigma TaxID=30732 RepID=A0A3B3DJS2_ORYME